MEQDLCSMGGICVKMRFVCLVATLLLAGCGRVQDPAPTENQTGSYSHCKRKSKANEE
jgi:hypothetical protein